jgi:hypothetical protein
MTGAAETLGGIAYKYTFRRVRFTGPMWAIQEPIGPALRSITSRWDHSADGVQLAAADAGAWGGSSAVASLTPWWSGTARTCQMTLWPRFLRREFSHKCRNYGCLWG